MSKICIKNRYKKIMLTKATNNPSRWAGTIYYNSVDIEIDYEGRPARPIPSSYGITFSNIILND